MTIIKAGNATSGTSIATDGNGILELKTGSGSGTTALTLDTSQNATFAGDVVATGSVRASGVATNLYPLVRNTYTGMPASYTASISGTTMNVTAGPSFGLIQVGQVITGTGVAANTRIEALGTGTGDIGTYEVSVSQAVASTTISTNGVEYQSIPSWVNRITIMFDSVTLSGTDSILVQLGDAGGIETGGYAGGGARITTSGTVAGAVFTSGFGFNNNISSVGYNGTLVLTQVGGLTQRNFTAMGIISGSSDAICSCSGRKFTSATMDRVRITVSGTNTFLSGSVNIMWE